MSFCFHVSRCIILTSIKDTEQAHRDLFEGYKTDIRPVLNQSEAISVGVDIGIISINTFNELSGILTLTVAFSLQWTDGKLRWKPEKYGNLKLITVSPETIWKPAFAMTTLAESINAFGDETSFKVRVYNNGTVHWWKTGIMKILCKTNVLYFPFDVQNCFINFVPVGYTAQEVVLKTPRKKFHTGFYRGNALWNLEESYAFSSVFPFSFGSGSNISYCNFHITIKRKPIFYIMTLIFPILIQMLISPLVFKLPIKSGERVSFAMTSFLSFAVFTGMVSDFLPHSTPLPAFIYFLIAALSNSALQIVANVYVLSVFHKDNTGLPGLQNGSSDGDSNESNKSKGPIDNDKLKNKKQLRKTSEMEHSYKSDSSTLDSIFFVMFSFLDVVICLTFVIYIWLSC